MLALAIGFYFLIGFICAVIFEIRAYHSYDVTERFGWLALWPIGLLAKALDESVESCTMLYYKFRDWKAKRAAKTVVHHPTR